MLPHIRSVVHDHQRSRRRASHSHWSSFCVCGKLNKDGGKDVRGDVRPSVRPATAGVPWYAPSFPAQQSTTSDHSFATSTVA